MAKARCRPPAPRWRRGANRTITWTCHFALLGQEGSISDAMIYAEAAKAGLDVNKLKTDMADPAIEASLKSSIALAHKVGVDGTPTFVLNGKFHPGALDEETLASEMKS